MMYVLQLFKGAFFYCEGANIKTVRNKSECLAIEGNVWVNRKYNFDDLGKALMSLFVLSSRDGWVNIMYTGLDAVGVDQQVLKLTTLYLRVFDLGLYWPLFYYFYQKREINIEMVWTS